MNRKLLILLLCCMAMLVPSIASAQFFEKQKVVVWEVFDRNNDVKVAQATKQQIRTSIVDAFVNSRNYEAYEANMNDVKSRISAKGLTESRSNIVKTIKELYGVDYVIFTDIKIIQHSSSFDDFLVHLSSDFFSTETQKSERMFYVDLKSDEREIPSACAKLLAGLLGEKVSSQDSVPSQNQQWQSQQSAPQQSYQPATQPRPQQPTGKRVGEIVYHNGVAAVVIALYDGAGQHGLLMSAGETELNWYSARAWCSNLGSGWRLPRRSELELIANNKTEINKASVSTSFTPISTSKYWSSEEYHSSSAWCIGINSKLHSQCNKNLRLYVRAVATF